MISCLSQYYMIIVGTGTADLFSSVKHEGKDEWLNKGKPLASSLCLFAFKLFETVAAEDIEHWLKQVGIY